MLELAAVGAEEGEVEVSGSGSKEIVLALHSVIISGFGPIFAIHGLSKAMRAGAPKSLITNIDWLGNGPLSVGLAGA